MATENILVKEVHKDNSPTDYDSFLRWTWAGDGKRPPIYTTETADHFWNTRDVVDRPK